MRARSAIFAVTALLIGAMATDAFAEFCSEEKPTVALGPPSVLVIMDASKSMAKDAGDGGTRLDAAKSALRTLAAGLPGDARVGLRLYGDRYSNTTKAKGCSDTHLVSPVGPLDRKAFVDQVNSYKAVGFTPIGTALQQGAADLGSGDGPHSIVLVSDGGDDCAPPSPCSVAGRLARGGTPVSIQAIGLQVTPSARKQLKCIARRGNGTYRDAEDADQLALALRAIAARAARTFQPVGRPIAGAPQRGQAPRIGARQYVDHITPNSKRYYRVDLAKGQRLQASASLVRPCSVATGAEVASFTMTLVDPAGQPLFKQSNPAPNLFFKNSLNSASVGVVSDLIGTGDSPRAGPYWVQLELKDNGTDDLTRQLAGKPFPVELTSRVTGHPVSAPKAATPSEGDSGGGSDTGTVVGLGIGGLVVGVLLGGVAALARRRQA